MDKESYKEYKARIEAEQKDQSRDQILTNMNRRSEYTVDLDNFRPQTHRWVDRGEVMSCEGGNHPPHRAFKRR